MRLSIPIITEIKTTSIARFLSLRVPISNLVQCLLPERKKQQSEESKQIIFRLLEGKHVNI
jgi:hypothetical protein